jgi:conserved oligomeric Golgi complex subunit 6
MSASTVASPVDRKANSATPQPRNPVSLRVYKLLRTNFNDDATREALQTLSELYGTPASVNLLAKGKELKLDYDDWNEEDDDEHEANRPSVTVNSLVHDNTAWNFAARARKSLRRDMENKLAKGSRQFLAAFGEVDQVCAAWLLCRVSTYVHYSQKLDELQNHIAAMRSQCDEAETQLQLTSSASKSLLERAGNLRQERSVTPIFPLCTLNNM